MYNVYQHWDPLKVCIVGRSYPPEFYSWIKVPHVRELFEKIAIETEEDFQNLIKKLADFGVKVLRPNLPEHVIYPDGTFCRPPMTPRDYMTMVGQTFYRNESETDECYRDIFADIQNQGNRIKLNFDPLCNGAMAARLGRDLYFGTSSYFDNPTKIKEKFDKEFTNTRNHVVNTGGHGDGTYCPVAPGLIISLKDVPTYRNTFPGWEVVYLPNQSWDAVKPFLDLKQKNAGKWWIPGFEYDQSVIDVVENWLGNWVGFVEETVFDVNMLIVDPKNVIVFNYNKQVFDALERFGITPHIVTLRHRYFWDGGIHCVTSDLHREGTPQDYFPDRK